MKVRIILPETAQARSPGTSQRLPVRPLDAERKLTKEGGPATFPPKYRAARTKNRYTALSRISIAAQSTNPTCAGLKQQPFYHISQLRGSGIRVGHTRLGNSSITGVIHAGHLVIGSPGWR